jgi:signal transduction histidine kinase
MSLRNNSNRTALLIVGSAILLLMLAFLFVRTQASGYRDQVQVMNLLRELRDAAKRWDNDALSLANDLAATQVAVPDRAPIRARIFQELERGPGGTVLGEDEVRKLRAGVNEREAAFRALREAHARSLTAMEAARQSLEALTREGAARRSRNPERALALLELVAGARASVGIGDIEEQEESARARAPVVAALLPAALAVDAALGPTAREAQAAVSDLVAKRSSEADAWRKFTFLPSGSRAELLSQTLSREIESTLDEKDRWRAYLFAYAAALLVGVGYLGSRVIAAQGALRRANEELEARVDERTKELSRTLGQLRESEAQLVQTEKMSSLGQLVAGVAHEINTPLAYVKNSVATVRDRMPELHDAVETSEKLLALLREEAPDAAELQAAFDRLAARLAQLSEHEVLHDLDALTRDGMHGIEQISELVANLRNFSRLDRSRVASFNVNEGVNAALLIAKPVLRKIDVDKRLGDVPSITCSPSQVNQVLLNIITNAAQAIEKPRGRIIVETRRDGSDHVAVDITDDGKGIPPESLTRIFDPFYTTKAPGQGTGLGLSIAYKIVAQHGGRIDVRSEVDVGTTFTVRLPLEAAAEVTTQEAGEAGERARTA